MVCPNYAIMAGQQIIEIGNITGDVCVEDEKNRKAPLAIEPRGRFHTYSAGNVDGVCGEIE